MQAYFFLGEFITAREHGNAVFALYDEDKHWYQADILNHDMKTLAGALASHVAWSLGFPDKAARLSDEKDAHARRRGHPFDRAWALCFGSAAFNYRCEPEALRERAEEAERLAREHSLPFIWACLAPMQYGVALIQKSNFAEGAAALKTSLAIWEGSGGRLSSPYYKCSLAEAMAHLGDLDGAIALTDEVIAQIERPGWEERLHYAEILRIKGWILSLKGELQGAERNYLASLEVAREQQAKSSELRTSTSLARLWQSQGKRIEALDLLKPVYDWFTEGFDTKDLIEAKALLEELAR
jgi:predicted ATPase